MIELNDQLEDAKDALDHIIRTCKASRTQTRRLQWIQARAESGITGNSDWQQLEIPKSADSLIISNRKLKAQIETLEQQLKTATEALDWVLKDYKGICREGFQPSANWKKRIVMADSVLRFANNLEGK